MGCDRPRRDVYNAHMVLKHRAPTRGRNARAQQEREDRIAAYRARRFAGKMAKRFSIASSNQGAEKGCKEVARIFARAAARKTESDAVADLWLARGHPAAEEVREEIAAVLEDKWLFDIGVADPNSADGSQNDKWCYVCGASVASTRGRGRIPERKLCDEHRHPAGRRAAGRVMAWYLSQLIGNPDHPHRRAIDTRSGAAFCEPWALTVSRDVNLQGLTRTAWGYWPDLFSLLPGAHTNRGLEQFDALNALETIMLCSGSERKLPLVGARHYEEFAFARAQPGLYEIWAQEKVARRALYSMVRTLYRSAVKQQHALDGSSGGRPRKRNKRKITKALAMMNKTKKVGLRHAASAAGLSAAMLCRRRIDVALKMVKSGMPAADAVIATGVSPVTLERWLSKRSLL